MTDNPAATQDAPARLAQYRAAREGGDAAAIEAALAALAAFAPEPGDAARRDALGAVRDAIERLPEDARDRDIRAALAGLSEEQRAALAPRPARPTPMTAAAAAKLPRPPRLLSASGMDGAVLSIGEICLLAGAGGVGKSALAGEIALAVADPGSPDDRGARSAGGLLDIHGGSGPVLWLAWEETPGEIGARLAALAGATGRAGACEAVHVLDMRGWPLYGPGERHGAAGLYSARPEPLAGWRVMADAFAATAPRLVVLDPMLAAYVGEGNAVAPVREFLAALASLARERNAGVLALAHSNKASRNAKADAFDPGQIAGSAAWHDGVRGALVLDYEDDPQAGPQRRLAVTKANMGPARIRRAAIPRRKEGTGWIIGFHAGDDAWRDPAEPPPATGRPASDNRPHPATRTPPPGEEWNDAELPA